MTKNELDLYEQLKDRFQLRCEVICCILEPLKKAYKHLTDFEINGELVYGEGMEYWSFGGEEMHCAYFPKEYIYMDDNEIHKIVDDELKKREETKLHKKEIDEQMKAERERAEYERLKKIYG